VLLLGVWSIKKGRKIFYLLKPSHSVNLSLFTVGVTIGFSPSNYTIDETTGSVTFTVQVLGGTLETSVQVTVSTADGTATSTDPADFVALAGEVLEFNATTLSQTITVTIVNDNILESDEDFFALLDTTNSAVTLDPRTATAVIQEQPGDDGWFKFLDAWTNLNECT